VIRSKSPLDPASVMVSKSHRGRTVHQEKLSRRRTQKGADKRLWIRAERRGVAARQDYASQ